MLAMRQLNGDGFDNNAYEPQDNGDSNDKIVILLMYMNRLAMNDEIVNDMCASNQNRFDTMKYSGIYNNTNINISDFDYLISNDRIDIQDDIDPEYFEYISINI